MFTHWDKALVAVIMGVLSLLTLWFEHDFSHVTEQGLLALIAIVTPILVWLTPNAPRQDVVSRSTP